MGEKNIYHYFRQTPFFKVVQNGSVILKHQFIVEHRFEICWCFH